MEKYYSSNGIVDYPCTDRSQFNYRAFSFFIPSSYISSSSFDVVFYIDNISEWHILKSNVTSRLRFYDSDYNYISQSPTNIVASVSISTVDSPKNGLLFHFDLPSFNYPENAFYLNFLYSNSGIAYSLPNDTPSIDNPLFCSSYTLVLNRVNVVKHIDSDFHDLLSVMDRFKELYASDDLVAAKEAQQDYEDSAIADFTGSGSAAASLNDLGAMKNISSGVTSGLDTGYGVSDALNIFSTNSGFWDFFSQGVYDSINNVYVTGGGSRMLLKSGSGDISGVSPIDSSLFDSKGSDYDYSQDMIGEGGKHYYD